MPPVSNGGSISTYNSGRILGRHMILIQSTIVMSFNHAVKPKSKPQFRESSLHEVLLSLNACLILRLLARS